MSIWRDCFTHTCSYSIQKNPLWRIAGIVLLVIVILSFVIGLTVYFTGKNSDTPLEKAEKLLANTILFDGHNDFAFNLRDIVMNDLTNVNFSMNLTEIDEWAKFGFSQTDLVRLKAGRVKAQFWVARADCFAQYRDAVEITLEQIDVIKRLIANYSDDMQLATSAAEVTEAYDNGKIASLIGIGGGHSIQFSLGILRIYYELGARYISLTRGGCSTPWADAAVVDSPEPGHPRQLNYGLSNFGEEIVHEMNRLGFIIDLSHVSINTMKAVLISSKAPVIFSNSNAKGLCNDHHNVPDEILKLIAQTDGVVLVNFYPGLLVCSDRNATVNDVIEHLNYLRKRMSADNIGLGACFDGIQRTPENLEDTSKYPNLFAGLFESGEWTESEMQRLAGRNLLRLMEDVEHVRDKLQDEIPGQNWLRKSDLKKMNYTLACTTAKLYDPHPIQFDYGRYQ